MRFITLDSNKKVIGTRTGTTIIEGEIQSDLGEIGQIQQADGSFITPATTPVTPIPTLEDKVNYLYYKSIGVI